MTREQICLKAEAFYAVVRGKYPTCKAFDPKCNGRPFVPDGNSKRDKAAYILFTLDAMMAREKTMASQERWADHAYRQLRFVEGLLWGSGLLTLGEIIDIDRLLTLGELIDINSRMMRHDER